MQGSIREHEQFLKIWHRREDKSEAVSLRGQLYVPQRIQGGLEELEERSFKGEQLKRCKWTYPD